MRAGHTSDEHRSCADGPVQPRSDSFVRRGRLSNLFGALGLGLFAAASEAALPAQCESANRALVFEADGVPAEVAERMSSELEVEARRLGLEACRGVDGVPAVVARVSWQSGSARLEAQRQGRILGRDVPFSAETEGAVLELALILGDLVREAMAPSEPAPRRLGWAVGAQAALDGFPAFSGWLWGADVVGRLSFPVLSVEGTLSGRNATSTTVAQGTVGMAGLGGGLSLLVVALEAGPVRLHAMGGVSAGALRLAGDGGTKSTGAVVWRGVVDAQVGLAADVRLGQALLVGRAGVSLPMLGVSATADGKRAMGVGGVGFFVALGAALGGASP